MRLFDGVTVNPNNLSPTWQGAFGVAMLLANTLAEADKERKQRMARQTAQATTLEEVMEQSGLDLPKLEVVLTQFMGGTPAAQQAASYIVKTPDPVKLLHLFAQTYTEACPPSGPIVTPPPAAAAAPVAAPSPASRPRAAQFRPEFTREGMEAANAAPRPRTKLPTFRPEFTREGMAAQAASAAPSPARSTTPAPTPASPPGPATAAPDATSSAASPSTTAVTAETSVPAAQTARPSSLSEALARRLAARDRRLEAYQAELETRVRCVEAELAMLREEVQELHRGNDCPVLFLVPSAEPLPPTSADPAEGETLATGEVTAESRPDETPAQPEPTAAEGQAVTGAQAVAEAQQAATVNAAKKLAAAESQAVAEAQQATTVNSADAAASAPAEPPPAVTELESEISEAVAAPYCPNEAPASPGPAVATDAPSALAAEVPTPASDSIAPAEAGGDSESAGTPPPADHVPADEEPLPPPGSEADLVLAVEMLDEFSERTEFHYKTQIDQVKAMEGEVKLLRALVAREREARRVVNHG